MSNYKTDLKTILKTFSLNGESTLSIGSQVDDKTYFDNVDCKEWLTLDFDNSFNPNLKHDMNLPISDEDGDLFIEYEYINRFDNVLALNLWEYIYDPITAHKNIYQFLKPSGRYIGSYVFVYGKHNPTGTDYLRYTDDGIRKILSSCGFKNINITPIKPKTNKLTEFYIVEGMRVRGDVDHNVVGYIVEATK